MILSMNPDGGTSGPDITGTPSAGNYARWADANTLEARSTAQVLSDIGAQASDTDLTAIAALTSAADKVPYATGAGTWALADLTAAGRALIDDADAAAQLVTLGVAAAVTATKLDDLATPDDNTDLNASSARHGLCPKLSNVATEYLTGTGTWAAPSGASGRVVKTSSDASWTIPTTATLLHVVAFGGGGGGGSGGKDADNGIGAYGAAGGGGAAMVEALFSAAALRAISATLNISIAAGGTGGSAQSTDDSAGNAGNAGGNTTIACGSQQIIFAPGALGGAGGKFGAGTAAGGASMPAQSGNSPDPITAGLHIGGAGGAGSDSATKGVSSWLGAGGGGGGYNGDGLAGGLGGYGIDSAQTAPAGTSAAGTSASAHANIDVCPGSGGAGGAKRNGAGATVNGYAGGNGVKGGGGGGGGGLASVSGSTSSGAGGNGGDGFVVLEYW